jgi:HSP20 family protein
MNTLVKKTNGQVPATNFSGLVDRLFQNNLNRMFDDDFWGFTGVNQSPTAPANIKETGHSYELQLVAPGLRKEDLKVGINTGLLTISYEPADEANKQNPQEGWLRQEYSSRSFSRTFGLDDSIDTSKIEAKYVDGILYVSLPKKEGARDISRTIEIQ